MEEAFMNHATEMNEQNNYHPWKMLLWIFLHPKRVFAATSGGKQRSWQIPMLLLTVFMVILSLIGGPVRLQQAQMNTGQPPEEFQYWTEEQQNQFFESQQAVQGPLFIYIFPLIGSLVQLWLGWFLFGSILHLLMTLKGSREPQSAYLHLVAWAAMPFSIRSFVQIVAIIITRQAIENPGFSGFIVNTMNKNALEYLRILLSMIDIYSLCFLALLIIGSPIISGLKPKKSVWMILAGSLAFLILASLPAFILAQLGGLGTIRPFILF